MSDIRLAGRTGGRITNLQTADFGVMGAGAKNASGNFQIIPAGSNLEVGSGKGLISAGGAADFDWSASSGLFKSSTGAHTFGGSAAFASGKTLTMNATGGFIYAEAGVDRVGASSLSLGATNASGVLVGKSGANTTVQGSLIVSQDLTVNGTTTTINSTVVDIADRVVHVNHSTGVVGVPSAICGLSVHRGATAGPVDRDHSALVWDEGNSRWVFCVQTGGDDSTIGADQDIKLAGLLMSGNFSQTGATTFGTGTGTFTHNGAVVLAGVAVTASGAASMDLSGASGVFKTSTGAVTIGPGAISISGDAVIATGKTLSTTGTGMINLPALFKINSTAVGATVTAPNLDTLTNGSNADALHVHAAAAATSISVSGTAGETINAKALVAIINDTGNPRVYNADADGAGNRVFALGIALAASTASNPITWQVAGEVAIPDTQWDSVPAVANVGDQVFMSVNAGKLTLTAQTPGSGFADQRVGVVTVGGTGAVKIQIMVGESVIA